MKIISIFPPVILCPKYVRGDFKLSLFWPRLRGHGLPSTDCHDKTFQGSFKDRNHIYNIQALYNNYDKRTQRLVVQV